MAGAISCIRGVPFGGILHLAHQHPGIGQAGQGHEHQGHQRDFLNPVVPELVKRIEEGHAFHGGGYRRSFAGGTGRRLADRHPARRGQDSQGHGHE